MTPREEILRGALERIGQRRHLLTGMSIMTEEASIANNAIAQADEIKDGPSEEDRKRLEGILAVHLASLSRGKLHNENICDYCWAHAELKKYMGIE